MKQITDTPPGTFYPVVNCCIQRRGCILFDSFFLTGLQCPVVVILDVVRFHSLEAILLSWADWLAGTSCRSRQKNKPTVGHLHRVDRVEL